MTPSTRLRAYLAEHERQRSALGDDADTDWIQSLGRWEGWTTLTASDLRAVLDELDRLREAASTTTAETHALGFLAGQAEAGE